MAAAEAGYRRTVSAYPKTGAGWVARLGLAGILFDQKKWDEALSHYRAVRSSEIAKVDPDVLGRAIEGTGLCLEAKGDRAGALTAFRELTNQEVAPWLSTLGLYHQARLLLADGNKEKAKELANKAKERLEKETKDTAAGASARSGYLAETLKLLLARIEPAKETLAPNIEQVLQQDPEKLQKLIDDLKKQAPPATPSAPAPSAPGGNQ
jgi:tetratricopeptide (TPR) repeat protein